MDTPKQKSKAATVTQNPFPLRANGLPDYSGIPTHALICELERRKNEVVLFALTPDDVCEYWECDESGATSPAALMPSLEAWGDMRRAFDRVLDCGAHSDFQSAMREAWIAADPESFADGQEGGAK